MTNPYALDLDKNPANHQPLTPLSFLERAAKTYPDHVAIIHGRQRITYLDFWRRSLQLASALAKQGVGKGDTVTVMLSISILLIGEFADPAALVRIVADPGQQARVRPDQKIVFARNWPNAEARLKGTAAILSRLAKLAEGSRASVTVAG